MLWLAVQHKLSTRDRLVNWEMRIQDNCVLCDSGKESHHHLFFQCPFSSSIWFGAWRRIPNSGIPSRLLDVVNWFIVNVKGKGFSNLVKRSVLAAAVYVIWMERNRRVFQGKTSSVDEVSLKLVNAVKRFS